MPRPPVKPRNSRHEFFNFMRHKRKMLNKKRGIAAFHSESLRKSFARYSLILVGGAAGWIDGQPMTQSLSRRSHHVSRSIPDKFIHAISYLLDELPNIDVDYFFSEVGPQLLRMMHERGHDDEIILQAAETLYLNFEEAIAQPQAIHATPEIEAIVSQAQQRLALSNVERDVMALAMIISSVRCSFSYFAQDLQGIAPRLCAAVIAKITGHPQSDVLMAISPAGLLSRLGILDTDDFLKCEGLRDYLELSDSVSSYIAGEMVKDNPSFDLLAKVEKGDLNFDDFDHLRAELRLAKDILAGALKEKKAGTNLLLVGPPGSGKNEAAKVLCAELGVDLYQVEFADPDSPQGAMDASERLRSYNLGQRLLGQSDGGVLLFDEIEDVLDDSKMFSSKGLARSKAYTNSLLENNSVPTIWLANKISRMDPAWLRRFSFVLEVPVPPRKARARIFDRIMASTDQRMQISPEFRERLIDVEGLSAGQLKVLLKALDCDSVLRNGRNVDERLEILLRQPLRMSLGLNSLPRGGRHQTYDLAFINSLGTDIQTVVSALERQSRAHVLLSGPPGTGKTSFSHYVAQQIGKPLLRKTASDLLSPYVGQTEHAIAAMFEEARRNDCVLLLDEADGMIRSREQAVRSWEVTQVNELLSRMEDFQGMFFCSTNFPNSLDPAAMRRFLFKLQFDYLTDTQAVALLERHLADLRLSEVERSHAEAVLHELGSLTPADFANVQHRLNFLGTPPSLEIFLDQLSQEVEAKLENKTRKVGF